MYITDITPKLSAAGFCREARVRTDEKTGYQIIDWTHRKTLTMYSLFLSSPSVVEYIERTYIKYDNEKKCRVPVVTTISRIQDLDKTFR